MPRKKKKAEVKEEPEILITPCTCDTYPHDPNCPAASEELVKNEDKLVVVEVSHKAQFLTVLNNMPELPDFNRKDFHTRLYADFVPQYKQVVEKLKELIECLL